MKKLGITKTDLETANVEIDYCRKLNTKKL